MRILITNDDGINAPGLKTLLAIAQSVAGEDGEVWTVAPAFEQSGVAHCISYTHPTMVAELGPRRFAAEGSPADCVLAGLYDVMKDAKPDLILSGVNRGNNSGENVMYSGTIGAAIEATLQGVPSIALSQYLGPDNHTLDDPFEAAATFGADIVRKLVDRAVWQDGQQGIFYNINFPPLPASAVKGTRVSTQGLRDGARFSVEPHLSPTGRRFLWVKGGDQRAPAAAGTDVANNLEGYISVTPMRCDLTANDLLSSLEDALA